MKKLSIFIVLLSVVDVILLAVILKSWPGKTDANAIEQEVVEASVEPKESFKKQLVERTDRNDDEKTDVDEKADDEKTDLYDVEGIEGIVDIDEVEEDDFTKLFGPDLATTERPGLSDFMWYFDGAYYYGIPDDVTYVYDSEQMVGDWKGFIFIDPERKYNSYAFQFLNVNIDIDGQSAYVVFDMYQYCPENSEIFDMNGEKQEYSGNFENGAVFATGIGNVHIDSFYFGKDNRQYAIGSLDTPDGTPAYLALVRP